ncbi:MAG: DUF3160 domain-containing protein [bacterium]
MKNKPLSLLCILLICSLSLTGCRATTPPPLNQPEPAALAFEPEFTKLFGVDFSTWEQKAAAINIPTPAIREISPAAQAEPALPAELRAVYGSDRFQLSPSAWQRLQEDRFFIIPNSYYQPHFLYDANFYNDMGSFVTTDVALHYWHELYDCVLRTIEHEKLYPAVKLLTEALAREAVAEFEAFQEEADLTKAANANMKEALERNIAYLEIAQRLLNPDTTVALYPATADLVEQELALIKNQAPAPSPLFKQNLDYSQFKVRGHYTLSAELSRYFQGLKWFGHIPLALTKKVPGLQGVEEKPAEITFRQALALTKILSKSENRVLQALWETVYITTSAMVGEADDITFHHMAAMVQEVAGVPAGKLDLKNLALEDFFAYATEHLPRASITQYTDLAFRVFGERYTLDGDILDEVTHFPERRFPSHLDVAAAFGSHLAWDILEKEGHFDLTADQTYTVYDSSGNSWEVTYPGKQRQSAQIPWSDYPASLERMHARVQSLPDTFWQRNIYNSWLDTLRLLINQDRTALPAFMQTEAWQLKDLATMVGNWAELRRDTILYSKMAVAEAGGDEIRAKGYVEPRPDIYRQLGWLTEYLAATLERFSLLTPHLKEYMSSYHELVDTLAEISRKELAGETPTPAEQDFILWIGGRLEELFIKAYLSGDDTSLSLPDESAVIADVHTSYDPQYPDTGMVLEEASGRMGEIFVLVPIDGEWHLTRGAVFSPYEFISADRFSDEDWQRLLQDEKNPPPPTWMERIILPN